MAFRYPPGPDDHLFGLRLAARLRHEPLRFAQEIAREYGDLASFRLGPYRAYVANHPAYVREVLVTQAGSFRRLPRVMHTLAQVEGESVVTSEEEDWLSQRRSLQPAFDRACLDRYARIIVASTRRLLDQWPQRVEVNIADSMTSLVLEVLTKILIGVELPAAQVTAVCEAMSVLSEVLVREMGLPFRLPDWLPVPAKRRKKRAIQVLDTAVWALVRGRPAAADSASDLLGILLARRSADGGDRSRMDRRARDEVVTLLQAGLETTAAGLAWLWYLVGQHADVEAKLVQDISEVLGERPATLEDVSRLDYTSMVVREALRLYVPTWILFPRLAVREVELGGYVLRRGSWLLIFPYTLHRDPRWFTEPETFDPERFAPGRLADMPPCAYIPFGAGPRLCLGQKVALTLMTLVLATVLQRFRVKLAPGQGVPEPQPFLALRPKGGVRVVLTKFSTARALPASHRSSAR